MKKELALELLALGKKQNEVAKEVGVSERTIRRWLKEEEFQKKLEKKVREKVKEKVLKEVLQESKFKEKKERVLELLDKALTQLDYSKPMAVDVLVKLLKIYTDIEEKRKDRLLEVFKKLIDTEKDAEGIEAIRIIIEKPAEEKDA